MSIKDVFANFEEEDYIPARAIYTTYTFNSEGISIYYYIYGKDSQSYDAAQTRLF